MRQGTDRTDPGLASLRLARACRGDRRAARALLSGYAPRARNLARWLAPSDATAEFAAAKALRALALALPTYKPPAFFDVWADRLALRTILRTLGPDAPRRPWLRVVRGAEEQDPDALTYAGRRRLVRRLDAVPCLPRRVIVLRAVLDLDGDEVFELLGEHVAAATLALPALDGEPGPAKNDVPLAPMVDEALRGWPPPSISLVASGGGHPVWEWRTLLVALAVVVACAGALWLLTPSLKNSSPFSPEHRQAP